MKLLLTFVVCLICAVDVSFAFSCMQCNSATCTTTPGSSTAALHDGTNAATACRTQVTIDAATTTVTTVRDGVLVATCTGSGANVPTVAATFAAGSIVPYVAVMYCAASEGGNSALYAAKNLGCYVCSDPTGAAATCVTPGATTVKAFDGTFIETGKSCSTVLTYAAGKLTSVVRARVETTACTAADTSASGDGIKTICCSDKVLCNDAVAPATIPVVSTQKPTVAGAGVPKHAPKNIINAFVLISAVILAVVSK